MRKVDKISIQTITWVLLALGFFMTLICVNKNLYIVNLKLETSQNIAGVIIGASGAFIGFAVIYLTISFENYKKIYGQYATLFFGRNHLIRDFLIVFILPIVIGLAFYIFSDTENLLSISNWLFNFTCYTFFVAIGLLFPYAKAIIKNSSSNNFTEKLILELNISDFVEQDNVPLRNVSTIKFFRQFRKSKPDVISDILLANIKGGNGENGIIILNMLFEKIKLILNDIEVKNEEKQNIAKYYAGVIKDSFDLYHSNKDSFRVKLCLAASDSLNSTISKSKLDENFIEIVFELIIYITKSLIDSESELLVSDAVKVYFKMSAEQLENNTPEEDVMWDKNDTEWIKTINTHFDKKFRKIEEYASYGFNDIVKRSFLCKNYHITENCVRMLANFSKMVFYKNKLGPHQKKRIGSMLAYHSSEAIKQFSNTEKPFNDGYLNLYLDDSSLIFILKANQNFSEEVFDMYIELVEFLISTDNLSTYEMKELAVFCRQIIACSPKISRDSMYLYVFQILDVQKIIMTKNINDPKNYSKKVLSDLKKDIKSYLDVMKSENVNDSNLKSLIERNI